MHREIKIKQFPIVTTHWWPKTRNERFVWENEQYCGGRSKRQTQWASASERLLFNRNNKIKCPKGMKWSKINRGSGVLVVLRGLWRRGQCSGRKGPGKGRSPAAAQAPLSGSGARGAAASPSSFILLRPTAPPGTIRPGILARQPYSGCGTCSLNAPFLDPRGHQRACTGRDRSPEERRTRHITAAVMRLHSLQVCLITHRQPWLFQRPSSLTHPLPSRAWWRAAIKGRGDADN